MNEFEVEVPVVDFAIRRGWFVRKLQWVGRTGAPDRMFAKGGRCVFVEFKAPGQRPRPDQEREIAAMRRAGLEVHVIEDIEKGKEIFL